MNPEEIAWGETALGESLGEPIFVSWLGTAGFRVTYQGVTILFDPYVTRASLLDCVSRPLVPDVAAIREWAPRADAIVVGHTHFDHVLDVPTIAKLSGAQVFGSKSAGALCLAEGVDPRQVDVVERDSVSAVVEREVGPFRLRFIPSLHSPFVLGRVPLPGDIADCEDVPLRTHHYRCGAVFNVEVSVGGKTLFHMGSANMNDGALAPRHTDLLLLTVAGWTSTKDFPERVVSRVDPGAVLLSHWDNFFRPMSRPALALPMMHMGRLVERLLRTARGVRVGTVRIGGGLHLPTAGSAS